jgi:hypothetical protein
MYDEENAPEAQLASGGQPFFVCMDFDKTIVWIPPLHRTHTLYISQRHSWVSRFHTASPAKMTCQAYLQGDTTHACS